MKTPEKYLLFTTPAAWRAWLKKNHSTAPEAWLLHSKKNAPRKTLTYEEALDEALCFGWIDGLLHTVDDEKFALRYSPRKPKSVWSEGNKRRVERLIGEGRMTAAGLAKIEAAKVNGEWAAATARENVDALPPELEQALKKRPAAWRAFQRWSASRKRQYLYWLLSAKRPATRQKRIQAIVEMAMAENIASGS
jgi:uncharacterized protein YdeI (YjbR/CyaY-like superfamily)